MAPELSHAADHDRPMTLVEYPRELRAHLIRTILAGAVGIGVGSLVAGQVHGY